MSDQTDGLCSCDRPGFGTPERPGCFQLCWSCVSLGRTMTGAETRPPRIGSASFAPGTTITDQQRAEEGIFVQPVAEDFDGDPDGSAPFLGTVAEDCDCGPAFPDGGVQD